MDNTFLIKLGLNTDELVKGINKSNQLLGGFQNSLNSFGKQIAGGLGFYGLSQAIISAVGDLATFEKSMSEVKAITGATGAEFEALRNNALNLAGAFSALDISRLETEFGRLGFSTREILDATTATISLASATGSDLGTSATIAGSTLRAFNLNAKETGHVADVMAGALNRTGLDMSNFAESIKYVAPNAYAANISLEETSALLGVLADNGIKGSMAGTTLRRILQDLSKDGRPLSERLRELADRGLNVTDAMDEVGRIGSTGLLVLTKNIDRVNELADSLHHVDGEAKAMSDIMQDNVIGDWNRLAAEFQRVIQQGSFLNDVFRGLIGAGTEFLKIIQNPWTFFETPVNDAVRLWDAMFNTPKLKEFNDEAGNSVKIFKSITDQLNAVAGGPLTPDQMGGTASVAARAAAAYAGQKANGPKTDTVNSDPTAGSIFGGNYMGGGLENITKDVGYASQAYQEFFGAIDEVNDALALETETIDSDVTAATDKLIEDHNRAANSTVKLGASLQQMGRAIRQVFISVAVDIGKSLGDVFSGGGGIEKALLGTLGSLLTQMGQMAIAIGFGLLEIELSLETLNPFAAIAAGIGLVALGSYFSNQSSSIGSSIGGGGSSGSGSSISNSQTVSLAPGTFRIAGPDLVYAYDMNKQLDTYKRG